MAVLIALMLLGLQIRQSDKIEERDAVIRRAGNDVEIYLRSPDLAEALDEVKAVDGVEEPLTTLMDRYKMNFRQAAAWNRFIVLNWREMEAEYLYNGPSRKLDTLIRQNIVWPDQRIRFGDFASSWLLFNEEFRNYVHSLLAESQ